MYDYIIGTIKEIGNTYMVVENHGIGYCIYTPNPYSFQLGDTYKVYVYQQIKEDEHTLYGFQNKDQKQLFLKLIEVKGLGCKMALPILATGSIEGIIDAIERENILYLKKFPKIGDKVARQIILDLKGKLVRSGESITRVGLEELSGTLKGLGYKQADINKILPSIDATTQIEDQIKEALKLLLK